MASKQWQRAVDTAEPSVRYNVAQRACGILSQFAREKDSLKVLVKSSRAIVFPGAEEQSPDIAVPIEYPGVVVHGWLGRISYIGLGKERLISWPIYDAQVLNTAEVIVTAEDLAVEPPPRLPTDRVTGPLHLPVGYIDFAVYSG